MTKMKKLSEKHYNLTMYLNKETFQKKILYYENVMAFVLFCAALY